MSDEIRNGDVDKRLRKEHAERLQAARQSVDEAEDDHALDLSPSTIGAVSRLIKAHIELALLERGGAP